MAESLKIIRQKLQEIYPLLNWSIKPVPNNNSFSSIQGLINLRDSINEIEKLDLFNDTIKSLKNSVIFTTSKDSTNAQNVEAQNIDAILSRLTVLTENFLRVLKNTIPDENPNSINIKLPVVNDFDELSKAAREIHISLSQVIFNDQVNGQTKIVSVENGSIWFNVFLGTSAAVTVVASITWSAAVIYKKILEGRLLEQQVRGLNVKNESIEDLLTAQKAQTELLIEAEAEHIASVHFKENIPENIERIKNSLTTIADLISKGAEIHPALVAPEDVSNLFPDPKNLIGLESKIKKISAHEEN